MASLKPSYAYLNAWLQRSSTNIYPVLFSAEALLVSEPAILRIIRSRVRLRLPCLADLIAVTKVISMPCRTA